MNNRNMNRIFCIISSVLNGLSTIFPFVTISALGTTMSKSLLECSDGIFFVIIAVIALIGVLTEKYLLTCVMGVLSLALFIFENTGSTSNIPGGYQYLLQHGVGYYLLIISAVGIILFSYFASQGKPKKRKKDNDNFHSTLNS